MTTRIRLLTRSLAIATVFASQAAGAEAPPPAPAPPPVLTLSGALRAAIANDPDVPGSAAKLALDLEAGEKDRASLLPSLKAEGAYDYTHSNSQFAFGTASDDYPAWSAELEARQALFRFDWSARRSRARAQDVLATDRLKYRAHYLLMRVAERYMGVLGASDEVSQVEAEARAIRESLDSTRKRYEVDLVPGTDLKEAQARSDLAEANLLAAHEKLDTARDLLALSTGNREVTVPRLEESVRFPALVPADVDSWVKAGSEFNPEIAAARNQLVVAEADVRSSRAEALPQLDLVAKAGRNDSTDFILGQRQDSASIGVALNVPIYAGGINSSNVRAAKAREDAARADLNRLERETERQVRQQFRLLKTAYTQVEAYERALESSLLAEKATHAGYDAGTRTITDVLDAKSRVVQASRNRNQSRYNLLLYVLKLRQVSGQIAEADFAAIDQMFTKP